ncbi:MAG: transcriptional repressor LexA [Alphaproteobacteria bacterium]|nr:transcriptional repressor LexA [Alphaproteobacteria bacterium]
MPKRATSTKKRKPSHGGARPGAGRPKGTGQWGEATRPMRIPESLIPSIQAILEKREPGIPLYASDVPAGLPGLADDHIEQRICLDTYLVPHPEDTFLLRVSGDSMIGVGIFDKDILIVDRQEPARNGHIVVANINGQPTVKTFRRTKAGKITLMPENTAYPPIPIAQNDDFAILGCVVGVVRKT